MSTWQTVTTKSNLQLHLRPTEKFKTTVLQLYIARPLDADYSQFALLPHVLRRGSADFPDALSLARRLDDLYGASLRVSTHKFGDRHVFGLELELANEQFLPKPSPLLREGLTTLASLLLHPLLESDAFRADYVQQAQEAQIRTVQGIFNDKAYYAQQRAVAEAFRGQPYARLSLGAVDELAAVTPAGLYQFYQQVLAQGQFHLFVSGPIEQEQVRELCEQTFTGRLGQTAATDQTVALLAPVETGQTVLEKQDVSQGKLAMVYHTGLGFNDPLFPALMVYNGILGGFGHSKLFQNVRERASLAYSCYSSLLPEKGALLVEAGIANDKLVQTQQITAAQLAALRQGDITEEEWDKTIVALRSGLRGLEDRPAYLAVTQLQRMLAGWTLDNEALVKALGQVTLEQVVAVAKAVTLHTVYFLHGQDQSGGEQ